MHANTPGLVPQEPGWVGRLFTQEVFDRQYQELKFVLHRKLLDRINLELLSSVSSDRVRSEVRAAVSKLVEEEKTPLSIVEKDRIIGEVIDEVFGLGPLEPLLWPTPAFPTFLSPLANWYTWSAPESSTRPPSSSRTTRI
jgi:hypothetical protein